MNFERLTHKWASLPDGIYFFGSHEDEYKTLGFTDGQRYVYFTGDLAEEDFARRYSEPAINNLLISAFDAEFPEEAIPSIRWEAEALIGSRELSDRERYIIERRKAASWRAAEL